MKAREKLIAATHPTGLGPMKWYLFCRMGRERKWSRCNRRFAQCPLPNQVEFLTVQVPADWKMYEASDLVRWMKNRFHRSPEPGRWHIVTWSESASYRKHLVESA